MKVLIKNNQIQKVNLQKLKKILLTAMELLEIKKNSEVSLLLTDNREIQYLNRIYRNTNTPTDVLSFGMNEGLDDSLLKDEIDEYLLGDIIISIETAQKNAESSGYSLMHELNILIIHGLLHLLGFDHNTDENFQNMKEEENKILKITEYFE